MTIWIFEWLSCKYESSWFAESAHSTAADAYARANLTDPAL